MINSIKKSAFVICTVLALVFAMMPTTFADSENTDICTIMVHSPIDLGDGEAYAEVSFSNVPTGRLTYGYVSVVSFVPVLEGFEWNADKSTVVVNPDCSDYNISLSISTSSAGCGSLIKLVYSLGSFMGWPSEFTNFDVGIYLTIPEGVNFEDCSFEITNHKTSTYEIDYISTTIGFSGTYGKEYEAVVLYDSDSDDSGGADLDSEKNSYNVSLEASSDIVTSDAPVTVDVNVSGDAFSWFEIRIRYDAEALAYEGNSVITSCKILDNNGDILITAFGESLDPGDSLVTVASLTFSLKDSNVSTGESEISILNAIVGVGQDIDNDDEDYTHSSNVVTGESIILSRETSEVESTYYIPGFTLITYEPEGDVDGIPTYDGSPMYYYAKDGVWMYIVKFGEEADVFDSMDGNVDEFSFLRDGDVNGDTYKNIVDAQVAFDLSKGNYQNLNEKTMLIWLQADYNNDGIVTANDAFALQQDIII